MIGKTLAHYKIVEKIGAGGMGEVYRATDTRLGRDVALKILPAELAQRPERRTRFEREAKTISSLSHPGICTLHDFGHHDGTAFLVMELLEGETLARRLSRGPVSIEDALRWGAEIAEALDFAHTRGIVHRDLKPGNVMLTATSLKLLDFGLAKETAAAAGPGGIPEAVTEQLEGRRTDTRTDLFALGAVLYEMLTGKRAFAGDSQVALVASIMERDPEPVSSFAPEVPPALERTVRACLTKNPEERGQSARDVARELRWIAEDRSGPVLSDVKPRKGTSRERVAWAVAALALVAAAIFSSRNDPGGLVPQPDTTRFTFEAPAWRDWLPAISPDGRKILYRGLGDAIGAGSFRIRFLDSLEPRELPEKDFASQGFWSPDSRHVAYTAGGELRRAPIAGGPPETICAAAGHSANGDWHANGTILFDGGIGGESVIWRVDASGGDAERVFSPIRPTWGMAFLPSSPMVSVACSSSSVKRGIASSAETS